MKYEHADLYQYKSVKGISYTNPKGEKITLRNGDLFYFITSGEKEYVALDKKNGPYFKLNEDSVNKLSGRAVEVSDKELKISHTKTKVSPPAPEVHIKTKSFKTAKAKLKFIKAHKSDLVKLLKSSLKKVLVGRKDFSEHNVKELEYKYGDGYVTVGAHVDLSLGGDKSDMVEVRLAVTLASSDSFFLKIIVPRDNAKPKLILKKQITLDLVKLYERLKKKMAVNYGLSFDKTSYLFSNIFVAHTDGLVHSWGSKII